MIYTYFYFSHFFYILIKLMVASSHFKIPLHSKYFFSALRILLECTLKNYFHDVKYYFHAMEIINHDLV